MYRTQDDGVIRLSDNAFIPNAPGNRDWEEYQQWLAQGNQPEDADTPQTLEQAKLYVQQQIIDLAASKQESLTAGYSPTEQGTWDRKEQEAIAYLAGEPDKAKYLQIEAAAMAGTSNPQQVEAATAELARVIIERADQLRTASYIISGTRARKWGEVEAIVDIEEVLAYSIEAGWLV